MPPPSWNVWALYIVRPTPNGHAIPARPPGKLPNNPLLTGMGDVLSSGDGHEHPGPASDPNRHDPSLLTTDTYTNPTLSGRGDILSSGNVHPHPGPRTGPSSSEDPLRDYQFTNTASQWIYQFSEDAFQGDSSDSPISQKIFKCNSCGAERGVQHPGVEISALDKTPSHCTSSHPPLL